MEPRIQYAKTSDGVSIAYWTMGTGEPPLVDMGQWPWEHCQLEWELPAFRRYYERVASQRQLVRFDGRGVGLSQRDGTDLSIEGRILDLEAVVDRLDLQTFALRGVRTSGQVAVSYAAHHPERLSHLVLWRSFSGTEYYRTPQIRSVRSLMETDWEIATETVGNLGFGWSGGEPAREFASFVRECVTRDGAMTIFDARSTWDVTELLSQIQTPTLVVHRRDDAFPTLEMAKQLAARIPNAELSLVDYDRASIVNAFLGPDQQQASQGGPSGTAIILFADIADSTALTERLGDAAFRERARQLDESLPPAIRDAGGTIVEGKLLGDGVLATFSSARQAIDAARACRDASGATGLALHLGIHAGDVIREANNVFGGAVNLAARIADASAPGEILVSDTLRGLARTSAGVAFEDRGEHELKGIDEPQRLWAVQAERSRQETAD